MNHTGATLVKKRINWPHEVLYSADGKPAVYDDLTMVAFVQGYFIVVNSEMDTQVKAQMSQHLKELMEDTDLYGWDRELGFHAAWLNQLEQGRSTWGDSVHKLRMRRALVWHVAMATQAPSVSSSAGAGKKAATTLRNYSVARHKDM